MKSEIFEFNQDDNLVKIEVRRASIRDGIDRYLLASKGDEENKTEINETLKILRLTVYPNVMSVSTAIDGITLPISFEEFIEMDEEFINQWVDIVYKLNPHWRLNISEDEGKKKSFNSKKG